MTSITQNFKHTYDPANRLTSVNGQAVQWDDNGNMLADGTAVYKYNTANKLVGVTKGTSSIVYAYSGLGDRLKQIADGVTTDYTLDINAGLTQVLQDGKQTYLYGNQRISQIAETQTGYFLPDALGSMRQMTDSSADLTLARAYDPYGNVVSSSGAGETVYGYTGEMQSGGLVHLRARDYVSQLGRFTSRDTWEGDENQSMSYNAWLYVYANPVMFTDPSGHWVYNRESAVAYAMQWDHQVGLDPTYDFPQFNLEAKGYNLGSQCTHFASSVLHHGGVRDPRADPNPDKELGGVDLYPPYWNIDVLMKEPFEFLGYKGENSWYKTPPFYDFATKVIGTLALTYNNPPRYSNETREGTKTSLDENWDALLRANQGYIQKGDLVFYWDPEISNWGHVAIVVGWGFPTYFGSENDQQVKDPSSGEDGWPGHLAWIESLVKGCSEITDLPIRPLVVERSGRVTYTDFRSLDNTANYVQTIAIVHVNTTDSPDR